MEVSPFFLVKDGIGYCNYSNESIIGDIQELVAKDLSEPYSIFTYRYFLVQWPALCICAYPVDEDGNRGKMIATIISKAENEGECYRGYIGMLAVNNEYRKKGIGSFLVKISVERMAKMGCDEITLEAEISNKGALKLYEKLGFMKEEMLGRYYLNGGGAYRLKLWIDKDVVEKLSI